MTPRGGGRTVPCSRDQARVRQEHAEKYLEVAELVAAESADVPASATVSASLAVLAGIAASDAACGARMGLRARGQDHRHAVELLGRVTGSAAAVRGLGRLLDAKDAAHYGVIHLSGAELRGVLRAAQAVVAFGRAVAR